MQAILHPVVRIRERLYVVVGHDCPRVWVRAIEPTFATARLELCADAKAVTEMGFVFSLLN